MHLHEVNSAETQSCEFSLSLICSNLLRLNWRNDLFEVVTHYLTALIKVIVDLLHQEIKVHLCKAISKQAP